MNTSDPTGEFGLFSIISMAVGAATNIATSYIAAKVTGQDFTLADAIVAGATGAASATPWKVVKYLGVAVAAGYSAYGAIASGASVGEVLTTMAVTAVLTVSAVSTAIPEVTHYGQLAIATGADFVFGTGANCISAATNAGISRRAERRRQAQTSAPHNQSKRTNTRRNNIPRGAVRVEVE